jgi:hypothetical protein
MPDISKVAVCRWDPVRVRWQPVRGYYPPRPRDVPPTEIKRVEIEEKIAGRFYRSTTTGMTP